MHTLFWARATVWNHTGWSFTVWSYTVWRYTAFIFIAGALASSVARAGVDEWTSNGPYGGPVRALAIDPQTPSILYAGTGAGAFRSIDSGATWSPARNGLPPDTTVRHLAIDPQTPNTLYASTGEAGLFKSLDGGSQWVSLAASLSVSSVNEVVIDPMTPTTLYAVASRSLHKSLDGGDSWTPVNDGLPANSFVRELAIAAQDPSTLYVSASDLLFRSTNGGEQWQAVDVGVVISSILALAIDPQNAQTVYATLLEGPSINETRIYRSVDGGDSWSVLVVNPFPDVVAALAVDPQDSNTLYASVTANFEQTLYRTYRSTDGGSQWTPGPLGPPTEALEIDPQSPNVLYAATSEGAWRSTDSADSWTAVNTGIVATSVAALASVPRFPNMLYAAGPQGVFRSTDAGENWTVIENDLPPIVTLHDFIVDPLNPSTLYLATKTAFLDILFDAVFRSTDGGVRWQALENGLEFDLPITSLVMDPLDPQTLYLGTTIGIYKTTSGGNSWQAISDLSVSTLAIDPVTPTTLYAGGFSRLHKSTDAGATWQDLSGGLPPGSPGTASILMLAINPNAPNNLFASGGIGFARSLDGGVSWQTLEDGLRDGVETLVVDPDRAATLYAGGAEGVFMSTNGGDSWTELDDGLVVTNVASLWIHSETPATIYAGTRGGGVVSRQDSKRLETSFLRGGRFNVRVDWRDFEGATGVGRVAAVSEGGSSGVQLKSSDSVVSQFFSPDNWELLAKVLDGRAINGHFWVFLSAATNVELTTTVTDTSCGVTRTYVNPLGEAAPAVTDTTAFPGCADPAPPSCVESESVVCLGEGGRFRVETGWRDFVGATGSGETVTIPDVGLAESEDSSLFYFFSDDNWELLIKVLDGCAINDRFWVFAAATTNVEYTITVTDTLTEQ
ncbi:MAG: YCF48-related protein, partial [Acidobacteriota bacterium]